MRLVPLETAELSARTDRTWVSPAYGEREDSTTLVYTLIGRVPLTFVTWISFSEHAKPPSTKILEGEVELLLHDNHDNHDTERRLFLAADGIDY